MECQAASVFGPRARQACRSVPAGFFSGVLIAPWLGGLYIGFRVLGLEFRVV